MSLFCFQVRNCRRNKGGYAENFRCSKLQDVLSMLQKAFYYSVQSEEHGLTTIC
jgi:hypothetical protein